MTQHPAYEAQGSMPQEPVSRENRPLSSQTSALVMTMLREFLGDALMERQYLSGERIYKHDYRIEGLSILLSGEIAVQLPLSTEGVTHYRHATRHTLLGLEFFTDAERYLCDYVCMTDVQLIVLPTEQVEVLLESEKTAALLLKYFTQQINLSYEKALSTLAGYLPDWSRALQQLATISVHQDACYWELDQKTASINYQLFLSSLMLLAQWPGRYFDVLNLLIRFHADRIQLHSPLYTASALLKQRQGHALAVEILRALAEEDGGKSGDDEQLIAQVALVLLSGIEQEISFYQGLCRVYDNAVYSENLDEQTPVQRLKKNAADFAELFQQHPYHVDGLENLPAEGGNIFILNHLVSHPYHQLPNGYELSLDTNFVASMLLFPHYGKPGIRVVRESRGDEVGHQHYYESFNHLMVHTAESEPLLVENEMVKKARRESFYQQAASVLAQGDNLIICPEGTSHWQVDSPGCFRLGTFQLAQKLGQQQKPVNIVPIVVSHFDKLQKNTLYLASVKPALELPPLLDDGDNKVILGQYIQKLQGQYKIWLKEAEQQALEMGAAENYAACP